MGFGIGILGDIIKNVFGFGTAIVEGKNKTKQLKLTQEHSIIEAQTTAAVNRIMSNTIADNEIDLITARDKKTSWKDEIVSYLFLIPVFNAAITPFIIAYQNSDWINLNTHTQESYQSLGLLPDWYKVIVVLIIIDILGFRSFARKVVDNYFNRSKM